MPYQIIIIPADSHNALRVIHLSSQPSERNSLKQTVAYITLNEVRRVTLVISIKHISNLTLGNLGQIKQTIKLSDKRDCLF